MNFFLFILLQANTDIISKAKVNYIEVYTEGMPVSGLLTALSVFLMILFAERWWSLTKLTKGNSEELLERVKSMLDQGDSLRAFEMLRNSSSSYNEVLYQGLKMMSSVPTVILKQHLDAVVEIQIGKMENRMGYVSLITAVAPMLGFVGTVMGMITAFSQLAANGDTVQAGQLAGGIYQAMGTTLLGLGVGLVAYFFYSFLASKIQRATHKMNILEKDFLAYVMNR